MKNTSSVIILSLAFLAFPTIFMCSAVFATEAELFDEGSGGTSVIERIEILKKAPMIIRRFDETHVNISKHSESRVDLTDFEPLYPGRSIFGATYETTEPEPPLPAATRYFEKTVLRRLIDAGDLSYMISKPLDAAVDEEGNKASMAQKIKDIVSQELRNHNQHVSIRVPFFWDEKVSTAGDTFWAEERIPKIGAADTMKMRRILRNLQGDIRQIVEQAIDTAVDILLPGSDLEHLVYAVHPEGREYGRGILTGARMSGILVLGFYAVVPMENGDCFQVEYLTSMDSRLTKEAIFLEMVNSMKELR